MLVTPLPSTLGAVVTEVDLADLDDPAWNAVHAAFLEHAVLVFPGQGLTSEEQAGFARRFGPLETLVEGYESVPISTVAKDGTVHDADHPVMHTVRGNQGWHTDSSYMPVSARASVLSARVVPASGGGTEWADMRAAYDALDAPTRSLVDGLAAFHSLAYSQRRAGYGPVSGYGGDVEPVLRPLVKAHPETGRRALYIGRHAHGVPGLSEAESEALLDRLLAEAVQPPRTYAHAWSPGDVVVWDNRCVLHRAGQWDLSEPRVMVHTRVSGDPATESALASA